MKLKAYCVGVFAGLSVMASVMPAVSYAETSIPNGWYVEGHTGRSSVQDRPYSGAVERKRWPWEVAFGYKFMPFLGAEFGYTRYSRMVINASDGTHAASDSRSAYHLAARAMVPVSNSGFEAYAKLGVARLNSNISIENQAAANSLGISPASNRVNRLYLALGGQYYFMPNLGAGLEFSRAKGNAETGDSDFLSFALTFLVD